MPPLRHFALAVSLLSPFAFGQQTPTLHDKTPKEEAPQDKTATLSVAARLVNLPVIVRDKKGAIVTTLTKSDFSLQVDGHPQTIRYFDRDANLPLTLGLLVDTSQSQRDVIEQERTASASFLDQMLTTPSGRAPDQAFVIQFAHETELLQDLTPSRPKLQAALKQIDTTSNNSQQSQSDPNDTNDPNDNSNSSGRGGRGGRGGGRGGRAGTTLYDAVFLSSDELMAKQKGRKALIILSDGVDNGSKENLAHSIETAQRADSIIYAIYFKGEEHGGGGGGNRSGGFPGGRGGGIGVPGGGYPGGGGGRNGGGGGNRGGGGNENRVDGKKILERMAHETGGRLFEVTKKQTVDQIYTQIAEELRSQYRLGYTPDEATASDGYHQVDLTIPNQKNLTIQTRDGYYTGK